MKKPSNSDASRDELREKLIGLGENSVRKSYYPELQKQLQNLRERVDLAELVEEIVQGLTEEHDLRSSLQRCSDTLVRRTDAAFVRIWTVEDAGGYLELQASSGLHTNIKGDHSRINIMDRAYKVGTIARDQKPLLTNQVAGNPQFHNQEWVKQQNIVAFAGYPLTLEQRLIGVIALFAKQPLNETVLDTLATIASQLAVGIERKRSVEELASYRDKLEVLVEDRTLKLQEAQSELLQNERLATLGKLTATVSHELRNPLGTIRTAIFSIADSLERKDFSHLPRALELAERNILRCVNIIEELTDFTRVKPLLLTETSLDDWLRTMLEEQEIPQQIQVDLDLTSQVHALLDQEKLLQVMINLVDNAVHALLDKRSNGKRLKIATRRRDDRYEIQVHDNGIGMPEETMQEVFEPLFSTKGFGVGLGMVVVKNIIEQHQGTITIESKEGEGTTVTLSLPICFTGE